MELVQRLVHMLVVDRVVEDIESNRAAVDRVGLVGQAGQDMEVFVDLYSSQVQVDYADRVDLDKVDCRELDCMVVELDYYCRMASELLVAGPALKALVLVLELAMVRFLNMRDFPDLLVGFACDEYCSMKKSSTTLTWTPSFCHHMR